MTQDAPRNPRIQDALTAAAAAAATAATAVAIVAGLRPLVIILAPAAVAWRRLGQRLVDGRGRSAGDELEVVQTVLDETHHAIWRDLRRRLEVPRRFFEQPAASARGGQCGEQLGAGSILGDLAQQLGLGLW